MIKHSQQNLKIGTFNIRSVAILGFRSDHRLVRANYTLYQGKKSRISFKAQPKSLRTEEDKSSYLINLETNKET
ncbi:unnamed protein product [Leptidea sinapis]|uniref:Uncharacterized protein n=1 Tax=Leptidea sinapis TaxID=189913 RepID=A0A5E4PRN7_9NEOP|nr:unnamed protein product [Leptidea sinapis]